MKSRERIFGHRPALPGHPSANGRENGEKQRIGRPFRPCNRHSARRAASAPPGPSSQDSLAGGPPARWFVIVCLGLGRTVPCLRALNPYYPNGHSGASDVSSLLSGCKPPLPPPLPRPQRPCSSRESGSPLAASTPPRCAAMNGPAAAAAARAPRRLSRGSIRGSAPSPAHAAAERRGGAAGSSCHSSRLRFGRSYGLGEVRGLGWSEKG